MKRLAVQRQRAHVGHGFGRPTARAASPGSLRRAQKRRRHRSGPGASARKAAAQVETALAPQAYRRAAVLDADALSSFAGDPERSWRANARCARTGGDDATRRRIRTALRGLASSDCGCRLKLDKAREAARASGAVVLFKGADTVVAAPDGRASILPLCDARLATAGSGDVLTGIIAGLLAQRMDRLPRGVLRRLDACARRQIFGPGLIAEDRHHRRLAAGVAGTLRGATKTGSRSERLPSCPVSRAWPYARTSRLDLSRPRELRRLVPLERGRSTLTMIAFVRAPVPSELRRCHIAVARPLLRRRLKEKRAL